MLIEIAFTFYNYIKWYYFLNALKQSKLFTDWSMKKILQSFRSTILKIIMSKNGGESQKCKLKLIFMVFI